MCSPWYEEEPEWPEETKDYRIGTAIIYREGKKEKGKTGYGYKFVETQKVSGPVDKRIRKARPVRHRNKRRKSNDNQ